MQTAIYKIHLGKKGKSNYSFYFIDILTGVYINIVGSKINIVDNFPEDDSPILVVYGDKQLVTEHLEKEMDETVDVAGNWLDTLQTKT